MSDGGKKGGEEGGGHSVGLWYVSFADMTTLLLSFFVMLATFSSYNKESLDKFSGAWAYIANYSIFPRRLDRDALVQPAGRALDYTATGSEKPTEHERTNTPYPRPGPAQTGSSEAYCDRRAFYVPSTRLFWGQGTALMPAGRQHLKTLAALVKLVDCHVVIGESVAQDDSPARSQISLERAWALAEYLSGQQGVGLDHLSIAAAAAEPARQLRVASAVEIVLLSERAQPGG